MPIDSPIGSEEAPHLNGTVTVVPTAAMTIAAEAQTKVKELTAGPEDEDEAEVEANRTRSVDPDDADDVPVKSPLENYLREINAFPLLTKPLEKTLAEQRDAANAAMIRMAASIGPFLAQNIRTAGTIGDAIRHEMEALKRELVGRYERLKDDEEDAPAPTAHAAFAAMAKASATTKHPLTLQPGNDDATLIQNMFALMNELPHLCNRVSTSDIPEVSALVTTLRDGFKRLQAALPANHDRRQVLNSERETLAAGIVTDPALAAYLEQLRLEGKLPRVDETTPNSVLANANLRLVVNIARGHTGKGLSLQDLIQEGNLGLLRAVDGYDETMDTRFSTYASYWIKQSIKRAIVNTGKSVRVPAYMHELIVKFNRKAAELQLAHPLRQAPTDEEVAAALGMPAKKLKLLKKARDLRETGPGSDSTGAETFSPLDMAEGRTADPSARSEDRDSMRVMLEHFDKLDRREREVLEMRFGLNGRDEKTLKEIGEEIGLTRERVRQIESEAMGKLAAAVAESEAPREKRGRRRLTTIAGDLDRFRMSAPDRKRMEYKLAILALIDSFEDDGRVAVLLEREGLDREIVTLWRRTRATMQKTLARDAALNGDMEHEDVIIEPVELPKPVVQAPVLKPAVTVQAPVTGNGHVVVPRPLLPPVQKPTPPPPPRSFALMQKQADETQDGEVFLIHGQLALRLTLSGRTRFMNLLTDLLEPNAPPGREAAIRTFLTQNGYHAVPDTSVQYISRNLRQVTEWLGHFIAHADQQEDDDERTERRRGSMERYRRENTGSNRRQHTGAQRVGGGGFRQ